MKLTADPMPSPRRVASTQQASLKLCFKPSVLLLFIVILFPSSVSAQPSYDDGIYGYDDPNDEGGYTPRPPPVVDNLYHDYAARQEAKVGGGEGIGLGGGYVVRLEYSHGYSCEVVVSRTHRPVPSFLNFSVQWWWTAGWLDRHRGYIFQWLDDGRILSQSKHSQQIEHQI
jgi:hypothetical protein